MTLNTKFFKIKLIKEFLDAVAHQHQDFLDEMMIYGTDPVVVQRRFRMLGQLAEYEAQMIQKIADFESEDANDFSFTTTSLRKELYALCNRAG